MKTWMYWAIIAALILLLVLQRKALTKSKTETGKEPANTPGSKTTNPHPRGSKPNERTI